jgi:membrane protein DedA with SNARE-associated domain
MLEGLITWYRNTLESTGGYPLIGLLMAVESSIVPLPSEIVIPPAAHLAHTGKLPLTMWGIVLAGTIGSWAGASVMYWGARLAGRPLVMRFGRYVFISPEKVRGAERWASHYGPVGVFISRLLPVVRHLIGIPAGIVRLDFARYSIYTLLGSAIWSAVLCWIGVEMGADLEKTTNLTHTLSKWLGLLVLVLGGLYYVFVHRQMKAAPRSGPEKPPAA